MPHTRSAVANSALRWVGLAVGTCLTLTSYAHAEESTKSEAGADPYENRWYGWQNLIFSVGLPTVCLLTAYARKGSDSSDTAVAVSEVSMFLGPPVIHWSHGRGGIGFLSLAMTPILAFAGGAVGGTVGGLDACSSTDPSPQGSCGETHSRAVLLGTFLGAAVGIMIDATVLAWEKVPVQHASSTLRLAPSGWLTASGGSIGINGAF